MAGVDHTLILTLKRVQELLFPIRKVWYPACPYGCIHKVFRQYLVFSNKVFLNIRFSNTIQQPQTLNPVSWDELKPQYVKSFSWMYKHDLQGQKRRRKTQQIWSKFLFEFCLTSINFTDWVTQITKDYSYNINVSKFKPVLYLSTVKSNHKLEMPDRVTSLFRSEEKTYSLHKVVLIDPLNCCWTWQQLSSLSLSAIQSFVSLSFFFFLKLKRGCLSRPCESRLCSLL